MTETTNKVKVSGRDVLWVAISYLGVLVIIPFGLKQRSDFIKHHLRQGLALLIAEIIFTFIFVFPIFGWIIGILGWFLCLIFSVIGFFAALAGKKWKLPLLSFLSKKINLD
ncbi:MAG: hypothetical protein PHV78_00390 [Patescibacteria group bacterium]|nr:hypothetical protein [Patescibacteria group bacterium]MDD5121369.1 hypothetical protein [Patescibacteria group bacterium]MDD5221776.1 hypothetical protein [Patescibacteria group bacterium]MDD5395712.1 hypothetical protein [Patescibacteria group bacterium]